MYVFFCVLFFELTHLVLTDRECTISLSVFSKTTNKLQKRPKTIALFLQNKNKQGTEHTYRCLYETGLVDFRITHKDLG